MVNMTILPLEASSSAGGYSSIIMMGLIFVVMYFFMIRPQQKKQKELNKFRDSLQKGDKVITAGGIYAKVKEVNDNKVVIEVSNNVDMVIDKAMLLRDMSDVAK